MTLRQWWCGFPDRDAVEKGIRPIAWRYSHSRRETLGLIQGVGWVCGQWWQRLVCRLLRKAWQERLDDVRDLVAAAHRRGFDEGYQSGWEAAFAFLDAQLYVQEQEHAGQWKGVKS
jgi:hypothetical protein